MYTANSQLARLLHTTYMMYSRILGDKFALLIPAKPPINRERKKKSSQFCPKKAFSPNTDLFFYDSSAGDYEIYITFGLGGIRLAQANKQFGKTWSFIVPGQFYGDSHTDLFLLDQVRHIYSFLTIKDNGEVGYFDEGSPVWFEEWYHHPWQIIIAGQFGGDANSDLLFYDGSIGVGQFWETDCWGRMFELQIADGWSKSWAAIVPGKFVDYYSDFDLMFCSLDKLEIYSVTEGILGLVSNSADAEY